MLVQVKEGTKPLVEAAFAAALAVILAVLGIYPIPILSSLMSILWTIPLTLLVARYSVRSGVLALGVITGLLVLFTNPLSTFLYVLQFAGVGLFFGYALNRRRAIGFTLLGGGLVAVVSTGISTYLGMRVAGLDLAAVHQQIQTTVDLAMEFYRSAGLLEIYAAQGISEETIHNMFIQISGLFQRILPGLLALGAVAFSTANYFVVQLMARRFQIPVSVLPPFRQWQMPWPFTWGVVVGLLGLLAGDYWQINWLQSLGQSVLVLYAPFLILFGIAVVSHYYQKSQLPRWFKIVIIVLSVFYLTFTGIILMLLGLFDPLFDYRKLKPGKDPTENKN